MPLLVLLLLGLAAPAALAQASSPAMDTVLADVRRAIDAGNAAYKSAFLRADAQALAQVYDSDGVRLNEGGVVIRGRTAISRDVAGFVSQVGPVRVTIETAAVWLVDDVAWESGAWSYTFQPKGKAEQRLGGRYVTLWRHQADGSWRIWRDLGVPGT
ncbi:MAG: SgcJ/EcaC family oxidoreductase [Gemmatimonadales bacterium]